MNVKTMLMTLGCTLGLMMNAGDAQASKRLIEDDLKMYGVSLANNTFHLGEHVNYSVSVNNSFLDQSSKHVFIEMYISDDATWSADDSHFSTPFDGTETVAYGFNTISSTDIIKSVSSNIGSKYMIFVIDDDDRVAEQAEWNNTYAIPVTITATPYDFELLSMSAPSIVSHDQSFSVPFSWRYNASSGIGEFSSTKFYLSTDANYSSGDLFIGWYMLAQMQSNITYYNTASININAMVTNYSWPTGDYYIIGVAQSIIGISTEANQSNNIKVSPIRVER